MTLDEALSEAVQGARVTAPHMQPGCYVEHSFSRGFVRCWPVDRPDEEPIRTQCDFRRHEGDEAAEWRILESAEQYPPKPAIKGGWGSFKPATSNTPEYIAAVDKLIGAKPAAPPISDVIELPGVVSRDQAQAVAARRQPWAPKTLDPNKGGW